MKTPYDLPWKRKLQDDVDQAYNAFRMDFVKEFGDKRPLLPDDLFTKYKSVFRAMITPHMYMFETEKSFREYILPKRSSRESLDEQLTADEEKINEKINSIITQRREKGYYADIANRRKLDESLARTHKLFEKRFDLIGYKQTYAEETIQGALLSAWPVFSFMFRDEEGNVYFWQEAQNIRLVTVEDLRNSDEIEVQNLSGFCHQRDIATCLGIKSDEYHKLCLELLNNSVYVNYGYRASRPLIVRTLFKTRRTFSEYIATEDIPAKEMTEEKDGKLIIVSETILAHPEWNKCFEVVYKNPIQRGIDPRMVSIADGRFAFDGAVEIKNSKLIGDRFIPYIVEKL